MTPEEVKAALADQAGPFRATAECEGDVTESCYVPSRGHAYRLGGHSPSIKPVFDKGRLKCLFLSIDTYRYDPNPERLLVLLRGIRDELTQKYGPPEEVAFPDTVEQFVNRDPAGSAKWSGQQTSVDLSTSGTVGSGAIGLTLMVLECAKCAPARVVSNEPFAQDKAWEQQFFSRTFWEKFDFRTGVSSLTRQMPDVTVQPRPEMFFGQFMRQADKAFGDLRVQLTLLMRKGGEAMPYGIALHADGNDARYRAPTTKDCRAIFKRLQEVLGPPDVKHARPGTQMAGLGSIEQMRAQWDVGEARIGFSYLVFDWKSGKSDGDVAVTVWHRSVEKKDQELTWIRCSQTLAVTFQGRPQPLKQMPDAYFAIDDFKSVSLLDQDLNPVHEPRISDAEIYFVRDTPKRKDEVRINRLSGRYSESRAVKDADVTATVTGHCEKSAPGKAF